MKVMLKMTNAKITDLDAVYKLSNDPVVRSVSLTTEPIPYKTHCNWFKKILKDTNSLFLVFHDQEKLVAQVRFNRISNDIAEISISISSEFRGKGIGQTVMNNAIGRLVETWPVKIIQAITKKDNQVSLRYFQKCGYTIKSSHVYKDIDCYLLSYSL